MPLRKISPPEKCPRKINPRKIAPRKIASQKIASFSPPLSTKKVPRKIAEHEIFCEFFLSLDFVFMKLLFQKKNPF